MMDKGLAWLKKYVLKQKQIAFSGRDRSDSEVSNTLFNLFHDSCVPQWQEVLGTGTIGGVCKGFYKDADGGIHNVAIKCCSFLSPEEAIQVVEWEMEAYDRLHGGHPNIVKCLGGNLGDERGWPGGARMMQVHIDGLQYFKLEELMSMNLSQLIHEDKDFGQECTYESLLHIFKEIAAGLEFLHEFNIIHWDLNSTNILVDSSGKTVKLSDFASSKIRLKRWMMNQARGPPAYAAPEVYLKSTTEESVKMQVVDVYSLGVIMWECVTRCSPKQIDRTLTNVDGEWEFTAIADTYFYTSVLCPPELRNLIASCLQFSMVGSKADIYRPTAGEVKRQLEEMLEAPWVKTQPTWSVRIPGIQLGLVPSVIASAVAEADLDLDMNASVTMTGTLGMSQFSRLESGQYVDEAGESHEVLVNYYLPSALEKQAKELLLFGQLPQHPNVVKCYGGWLDVNSAQDGRDPFVAVERLSCDLDSFLWRGKGSIHFQPGSADYHLLLAEIWVGIASGLEHLHNNGIIYQNLNPNNVFLEFTTRGTLAATKLGSLQHAEKVGTEPFHLNPVQNLGFMAPETVHNMHSRNVFLSTAVDVYSLGMLMWHCVEENPEDKVEPMSGFLQPRLGALPILLLGVITDCTKPKPEDRPPIAEVVDQLNDFLASNLYQPSGSSFRSPAP